MYSLLQRRGKLRPGLSILHFAPEPGLGTRLRAIARHYLPADFDVGQYANSFPEAERIDLCEDSLTRHHGKFDLVLHNHVLEHLACDLTWVLKNLFACLSRNGEMYFSVPIRAASISDENFDPAMDPADRKKRFGQHDHVRMLGENDALDRLNMAGRIEPLILTDYFSEIDLKMISVPHAAGLSGETIFLGGS